MIKKLCLVLLAFSCLHQTIAANRWQIAGDGSIVWQVGNAIRHNDHIEMSGQQMSVVLRYGIDAEGKFCLNRSLVFPMLRLKPNKTGSNLKQRWDVDVVRMITVDDMTLQAEKVGDIRLRGAMTVHSTFGLIQRRKLVTEAIALTRKLYPSPEKACYIEEYTFENMLKKTVTMRVPELNITYATPEERGVYGAYELNAKLSKHGTFALKQGDKLHLYVEFSAYKAGQSAPDIDVAHEYATRMALVGRWQDNLVLETPDSVLNTMFAFAKIRAAESIYLTKGGFMHGPGGEAYYAAIWANDQAEYINPFFPYLGYDIGNESAMNSFRHFARFMNEDYRPIPSSIISEGVGTWKGAKDRGDGAMIAYGAARYALACGSRSDAEKLWPLITWCLEYCKRKLTADGVPASDSDELENRFPAGDANLCTASLYYDALRSAAMLSSELDKPSGVAAGYNRQADALRSAIERHFGADMAGYKTYRYYNGNTLLRSWICIPLTVGIYDRSPGTVDALYSNRLWTGDGLLTQEGSETYWDRSTLYSFRGALAAGHTERVMPYLQSYSARRLLGDHVPYAIEAWPEGNQRHLSAESGLYCRVFTEGLLGIRPTGLRRFALTPHLPKDWSHVNMRHIRAHGGDFDICVSRKGKGLQVTVSDKKHGIILQKQIKEGKTIQVKLP